MRMYYEPKGDILVIELGDVSESPGAQKLAPGVYVDVTEGGKVLAMEINNASRVYPRATLEALGGKPPRPITIDEAAEFLGVSDRAVRAAISRGRLEAEKVGRDWVTTAAALKAYMASNKGTGPRKESPAMPRQEKVPQAIPSSRKSARA